MIKRKIQQKLKNHQANSQTDQKKHTRPNTVKALDEILQHVQETKNLHKRDVDEVIDKLKKCKGDEKEWKRILKEYFHHFDPLETVNQDNKYLEHKDAMKLRKTCNHYIQEIKNRFKR